VPNSTKVFLWRACHNILPTKDNLFKRVLYGIVVVHYATKSLKLWGIFCGSVHHHVMFGVHPTVGLYRKLKWMGSVSGRFLKVFCLGVVWLMFA
jgi:hypothetical protein